MRCTSSIADARATRFLAVVAVLALLAGTIAPAALAGAGEKDRFDVVVIDAGHGGDDTGALGSGGLEEKELVLDVSRRLAELLRKANLSVILTRPDDEFVPLESRTSIANDAKGDLFLSIHANASRSASPRGVETYFGSLEASDADAREVAELENRALGASAENALQQQDPISAILGDMMETLDTEESNDFAKLALGSLTRVDPKRSRGVKQAPFVVLMGVQMPASLVEIGFVTNRSDASALRSGERREAIAKALAEAVTEFGKRYDARRGIRAGLAPADS